MRKVIVMSGISGSGKSYLAEQLLNESQGVKVSADHFFMVNGEYKFDPSKLGEAHADCFRRFIGFLQNPTMPMIVVDNTNLSSEEVSPYMLGAAAFGWDAEIITLVCDDNREVGMCAARNLHSVPENSVRRQDERLLKRSLPRHWKNTERSVKFGSED